MWRDRSSAQTSVTTNQQSDSKDKLLLLLFLFLVSVHVRFFHRQRSAGWEKGRGIQSSMHLTLKHMHASFKKCSRCAQTLLATKSSRLLQLIENGKTSETKSEGWLILHLTHPLTHTLSQGVRWRCGTPTEPQHWDVLYPLRSVGMWQSPSINRC